MITKQQANEIMRLHYRAADLQEAASSADQSGYVNQAKKYEEQEVEALKKLHEFVNSLVEENRE